MPDLDRRLGAARAELLDQITVPDLGGVRVRAATLRRRRHGLTATVAAAACLAVISGGAAAVGELAGSRDREPVAARTPSTDPPGWSGGGLALRGLTGGVLDLPGKLHSVEFADASRGYALAAYCPAVTDAWCRLSFATTEDGGLTWVGRPAPVSDVAAADLPSLVPVGTGSLVAAGGTAWFRAAGQDGWLARPYRVNPPAVAAIPPTGRLRQRGEGCRPGPVEVWLPDGTLARLARQPQMSVCWVAPVAAADGAWWVGGSLGTDAGTPAVAVTRDAGQTWSVKTFGLPELPGAWVQVSPIGGEAFAAVLRPRADGQPGTRVAMIYRLRVRAEAFEPYGDGLGLGTLAGDLVPLLDGRLVAAGPGWMVSGHDGTGFRAAGGSMPWVRRLHRTGGGWIAEDLFAFGWAAYSTDGQSWRKIHVR